MLKYFKFNHTLRWLSANTSMHMQTNNVKDRGVPGEEGGGRRWERGERFIILPLCTPGGNFNATRIAFRLQHISLSLLSSFTDSFSLYPLLPLSVSFLYSPRAAVDHALTAIKVSICIAPVQHCKALLPTVLFCYIQCYILYAWQTFPLPD